jgi:3-hydroxyacyl-CoA dehydrogenase
MSGSTPTEPLQADIGRVAVVGAGVIGRSWALLFLRNGLDVALVEPDADRRAAAMDWIGAEGCDMSRCHPTDDLATASSRADWVQECGPDTLTAKRAIFAAVDAAAPPGTIIASSGSTFDPTELAGRLRYPGRALLVHPFNPPHLLPAVEIVPGTATDAVIVSIAQNFMTRMGRSPVVLNRYVPGLIINRLQGALMREAFDLYRTGVGDMAAIDACIADGLALRWVSVGTFGTNHTNADGGISEYFTKYPDWSEEMAALTAEAPTFTVEFTAKLGEDADRAFSGASVTDLIAWRDRLIRATLAAKAGDPPPWRKQN